LNYWVIITHKLNFIPPGILQADTGVIRDNKQMFRLFCHESMRVFHDRLINKEDKGFFYNILSEMAGKHFSEVRSLCVKFESFRLPLIHLLFNDPSKLNLNN